MRQTSGNRKEQQQYDLVERGDVLLVAPKKIPYTPDPAC